MKDAAPVSVAVIQMLRLEHLVLGQSGRIPSAKVDPGYFGLADDRINPR